MSTNITSLNTNISIYLNDLSVSEWCLVVAFVLILSTGICGNAIVIYAFGWKRKLKYRSMPDLLIFYLGIVDFFSSLFNPFLSISLILTRYQRWYFGETSCKIIPSLGPIMASISLGVLLTFAVDRYLSIVSFYHGSTLSWKSITTAFVINIFLSICLYLHYIFAIEFDPVSRKCSAPNVVNLSYSIPNCLFIVFRLFLFMIVFTFTTIKILLTLKNCAALLSRERQKRLAKSRKTMRVLLTMGMVFVLLVFPKEILYLVYNLSWVFCPKCGIILNKQLLQVYTWLKVAHTANSCANVFIYSKMQTVYRKQLLQIFKNVGGCKRKFRLPHDSYSSSQNTYSSSQNISLLSMKKCDINDNI